ncbi:MAG TPA: alanine--tRNA ligase [Atribacteraceae bacterium]|nr:alanine--tRNA ligase [Atribacteraceae bacterium]
MTSSQLRSRFLEFFQKKDHRLIPSTSLIPDDPTIFLTIAGMVQFKPIFLGKVKPVVRRACTAQKCLRVNDIEKVGFTARHHTFFEMLGNFSFGDYFKEEACRWAWEFLTEDIELPADRLWTSVHHQDREAYDIWKTVVRVPESRIIFLGDEDNFWSSGPVGPCGYCSEIYFDNGSERGCGSAECRPGCECDRYLEIWNLVFMQFDRKGDGALEELPNKNIDTGMGLERIASVVQATASSFETDLFFPVIAELEKVSGIHYRDDPFRPHFRIIADHIRSIAFLIADGIFPANEGRGYILRRLIRRAYRSGKKLSIDRPFLFELVSCVASSLGENYPELLEHSELISQLTFQEENRFAETLRSGLNILDKAISDAKQKGELSISGAEVFRLHDTYGFPVEVSREILQEAGMSFADDEYRQEMESQKKQSRKAQEEKIRDLKDQKNLEELFVGLSSEFTGYHCHALATVCRAIARQTERQEWAGKGERIICVLEKTPFYPEQGGQESDRGILCCEGGGRVRIDQVLPGPKGLILHLGEVEEGSIAPGMRVLACIDSRRRRLLEIHHTATHLLHRALRATLGETVKQAGSWVGETGLRFDFTHLTPMEADELERVEKMVNEAIFSDLPIRVSYSTLKAVRNTDVLALFDEKYEEIVRIVRVEGCSAELCGGTHLDRTSQAGLFTITSEFSIGSGLRRIEAMAGSPAFAVLEKGFRINKALRQLSQVDPDQFSALFSTLQEENRRLKKDLLETKVALAIRAVLDHLPTDSAKKPTMISHLFDEDIDQETMKQVLDALRKKTSPAVVVLGARSAEQVSGLVADLGSSEVVNVSTLLRDALKITGGKGGGKPHLAQYGGLPARQWDTLLQEIGVRLS